MNVFFPLLADITFEDISPSNTKGPLFDPQTRDTLVILGAILFVTTVIFLIVFINQRKRNKLPVSKPHETVKSERPRYFRARGSNPADEPTHRNPTLAERGGLPPIKEKPRKSSI